jgi:8-oxo-dGTP diphosphatase
MSLQGRSTLRPFHHRAGHRKYFPFILDHRWRALLTLRELPPEAGSWSIVGGKLEYLETLHDCAVGEALLRSGAISIEGLLCATDHLLPGASQHWLSQPIWAA